MGCCCKPKDPVDEGEIPVSNQPKVFAKDRKAIQDSMHFHGQKTHAESNKLNTIFQNSLDSSELDRIQRNKTSTKVTQLKDYGLPNIGNTCYLNSILQLIYSAEKVRKQIILRSKIMPSTTDLRDLRFHKLMANVFQDLDNRQSNKKKEKDLIELSHYLASKSPQYSLYQQNDSFQLFLLIFNLLKEQDPAQNDLLRHFEISYELCMCNCSQDTNSTPLRFKQKFVNSESRCETCQKYLRFNIISTGSYLLVFTDSQEHKFLDYIKMTRKDHSLLYFENLSFVTYRGTGQSGHYISYRKSGNKWIQISDSSVSQWEPREYIKNSRFILYNLINLDKPNN